MSKSLKIRSYYSIPHNKHLGPKQAWLCFLKEISDGDLKIVEMFVDRFSRRIWTAKLSDGSALIKSREDIVSQVQSGEVERVCRRGKLPTSKIDCSEGKCHVELCNSNLFAVCDESDIYFVTNKRWLLRDQGKKKYAICNGGDGRSYFMHGLILTGQNKNGYVDHIDGDGLNNQRANIRLCNPAQNSWNKSALSSKKVALKGVTEIDGLFRAFITAHHKKYNLGSYRTEEEASAAYVGAAIVLHGSYANFKASLVVEDPRSEPEKPTPIK